MVHKKWWEFLVEIGAKYFFYNLSELIAFLPRADMAWILATSHTCEWCHDKFGQQKRWKCTGNSKVEDIIELPCGHVMSGECEKNCVCGDMPRWLLCNFRLVLQSPMVPFASFREEDENQIPGARGENLAPQGQNSTTKGDMQNSLELARKATNLDDDEDSKVEEAAYSNRCEHLGFFNKWQPKNQAAIINRILNFYASDNSSLPRDSDNTFHWPEVETSYANGAH